MSAFIIIMRNCSFFGLSHDGGFPTSEKYIMFVKYEEDLCVCLTSPAE